MAKQPSQSETPPEDMRNYARAPVPPVNPPPAGKPEGVGTSLAPIVGTSAVMVGDTRYKIVKRVNTTTLTLDVDSDAAMKAGIAQRTIVARILEPIREGRAVQNAKYPTPAKLMLLEAADGTQGQIVVSHILQSELNREYPEDGYLGKWFLITKFRKAPDKRYNKFEIIEVESPTGEVQSSAA